MPTEFRKATTSAGAANGELIEVPPTDRLQAFVGRRGRTRTAGDPVNEAMIRHWCAALGDRNPVYLDAPAAEASVHGRRIAPPAMLQAWTMPGYAPPTSSADAVDELYAELDADGLTASIATNCEQEYLRPVHIGDLLSATKTIQAVSDEKATKLGRGRFITTTIEVVDAGGALVGRQLHRVLRFRPSSAAERPPDAAPAAAGRRPRPVVTRDTAFFFDGARERRLLIQRCSACRQLQHPPTAACPRCGSLDLAPVEASGRGTLFSHTVIHAPRSPGFDLPHVVGLVELEEGTRVVAELVDVDPRDVRIGMALSLGFRVCDPDLTLPVFRPASTGTAPPISVGSRLAPLEIALDRSFIVATAIASRDFEPIHHDPAVARARGLDDIIMNILTSNGLVGRFVTDCLGPDTTLRRIAIRLGVPNYPGDRMVLTGEVTAVDTGDRTVDLELSVRGANRLGDHLTGTVSVTLPAATAREEALA